MAHLPRLLVLPFLFLFLGIHVPASHGSPLPRTYDGSMCSESFCGSVNISHPFYLSNAYSCGYTDLMISCQGEGGSKTPIIQLGSYNYSIKNIFYNNHTIMLADADALRGTSCFKVSHNVTFDRELLDYTSSYDSLTFFYGCHFGPRDTVPPGLDKYTYKINCSGSAGLPGRGVSFVFTSEEHGMPEEYDLAGNCDRIFVAPVQRDFLTRGGPGGYGDVLKEGFELTWNRNTANPCYQVCNSSGASSVSASRYFNKRRKTYLSPHTTNSNRQQIYPSPDAAHVPGYSVRKRLFQLSTPPDQAEAMDPTDYEQETSLSTTERHQDDPAQKKQKTVKGLLTLICT